MAKSSINSEVQYKAAAQGAVNLDEAKGIVECFVAGIGNKDSVGDVCAPGAFAKSLVRRKPRVVWGHNWNDPIGKVLEIYEVPPNDMRLPAKMRSAGIGGLYAKVQFNLMSEKGREAFASVAFFGEEQEWSIGYKTINAKFDQQMQANVLYEVELYEVSPVLHGANQLTGTISVKSDTIAEVESSSSNDELREVISALKAIASNISDAEKCGPGMPMARPGAMPMTGPGMPSGPAPRSVVKPERPSVPENPLIVSLRRELVARTGSNIIVRSASDNTAVFDRITSDGTSSTYRIAYHYQDGEFMFGKPEKVNTQTVYTPESNPMASDAYWGDDESEMPKSLFIDEISTSSIATNALINVIENLQQMVEEKSEYFIPVKPEEAFEFKQTIDPVLDYYRAEARVTEEGIVVKSAFNPELIEALDVATKSVLGKIRRGIGAGRRIDAPRIGGSGKGKRIAGEIREATGGMAGNLDPSKISLVDPDGDGWAREGSRNPVWVGFKKAVNKLRGADMPSGGKKDKKPGDSSSKTKRISQAKRAAKIAPGKVERLDEGVQAAYEKAARERARKMGFDRNVDPVLPKGEKRVVQRASRNPLEDTYESMLDGFSSGKSDKPRYPRKPTYGPFLGDADEFFQAESWEEFKEKYAGKEIVYLDYETTGLVFDEWGNASSNGAPVQLGAVKVKDGKIVDRINLFMDPKEKLGQWSLDNLKNGDGNPLTDEWLSQQMSIEDAHKRLIEFAGPEAIFGAQNAVFDKDVLDGILDGMGEEWRPSGWLDTRAIAALALPKWSKENPDGPKLKNKKGEFEPSSSLAAITEYLGVELGDGHHNADVDAMVLDEVMRKMIDGAIENGWSTDVLNKEKRNSIWKQKLDEFDAQVAEFEKAKEAYVKAQEAKPEVPATRQPGDGEQTEASVLGFSSGKESLRRYIANPDSKVGGELQQDIDKYGEPEILDDDELDGVLQSYAKEISDKKSAFDAAVKKLSEGGESADKWADVLRAEDDYDSAIKRANVYAKEATDRKSISEMEGFSSGSSERRHAYIGKDPMFDTPDEIADRAEHERFAADFKENNGFWIQVPRAGTTGPVTAPEDWHRGREVGYNVAELYWSGDELNQRPKKFDPKARQSVYYMDWYENFAKKMGDMLDREDSGDGSPESISGMKTAVLDFLAAKRPVANDIDARNRLGDILEANGFGPGGRHEDPFGGAKKSNMAGFSSGKRGLDKKQLGKMLDDGKDLDDDDVVAIIMPGSGVIVHKDMRDDGDELTSFVSALKASKDAKNQNINNAKAMIRIDEDGFENFRDILEDSGAEFTPSPYAKTGKEKKYPYVWGQAALSSGKNAKDDEGNYPDFIEEMLAGESVHYGGSRRAERVNTSNVDMEIIPATDIGIDDEGPWTVVGIHRTADDGHDWETDAPTFETVDDARDWISAYDDNIENDVFPGDQGFSLPDDKRLSSGAKRKGSRVIKHDDGVQETYEKIARERAKKMGYDRNVDPSRKSVLPVQVMLNDKKSGRFGNGNSRFSSGSDRKLRIASLKENRSADAYERRERKSYLARRMKGMSLDELAAQEGSSRGWLRQAEARELARLRDSGTDGDVLSYRMGGTHSGLTLDEAGRVFGQTREEIRRRELREIQRMTRDGEDGDLAILQAYENGISFDAISRLTGLDKSEAKKRADRALEREINKADAEAIIFDKWLGSSGELREMTDEEIASETGLDVSAVAAVRDDVQKYIEDTEIDLEDYYSSRPEPTDEELEEMARYYGESLENADFIEDPEGFSSGRKGRGRKNKPLNKSKQKQWSEEDRRNFSDRNVLKSRRREGKRFEGPSADEFSSGRSRIDTNGSSALTSGYYDSDTERLVIGYENGGVYVYEGVTPEDAADLHNAESKGRAMAAIKKKYEGKRISSVDERFAKTSVDDETTSISPDSDTEYLISKSGEEFFVSRMTGNYAKDGGQSGTEYYHPTGFKSEDSATKWIEQDYLAEDLPDPFDENDNIDALSSGSPRYATAVQMQVDTRKSKKASKMAYSPNTEEVEVTYNDGVMRRFSGISYDEVRAAASPPKDIDDFIRDLESGRIGRDSGRFSSGATPPRTNYDYSGEAFEPTEEQKVIADAVATGDDVVVRAFAGTGKTSTLTLIAKRFRDEDKDKKSKRRIIYIAFNKDIQTEAEGRFPDNTETRTSDSIAWRWTKETLGDSFIGRLRVEQKNGRGNPNVLKSRKDVQAHFKIKGIDHPDGQTDKDGKVLKLDDTTVTKMVQEAVKQFAISADDEIGPQHFKGLNNVPKELLDHANAMWTDMNDKKGRMILDFEHITKMWALTRPQLSEMKGIGLDSKPDVIFFDEAQDINPVMAKVMAEQGIQMVYVGDSYQAIYGFRGATDTLQNVQATYDLPLTTSWRFGPEIQEIANRYLSFMGSQTYVRGRGKPGAIVPSQSMDDPDAVLTRTNAGALKAIVQELEKGRTVGASSRFKSDIRKFVLHAIALKKGQTPKEDHPELAEFETWQEVLDALATEGEASQKLQMLVQLMNDTPNILSLLDQVVEDAVPRSKAGQRGPALSIPEIVDGSSGKYPGKSIDGWSNNPVNYIYKDGYLYIEPPFNRKGQPGHRKTWDWFRVNMPGNEKDSYGILGKKRDGQDKWGVRKKMSPDEAAEIIGRITTGEAAQKPVVDVVVQTAHTAKGLEYGKVKIFQDWRTPKLDPETGEWEFPSPEDQRLAYVAATRAQVELDPGPLDWIFKHTDEVGDVDGFSSGATANKMPTHINGDAILKTGGEDESIFDDTYIIDFNGGKMVIQPAGRNNWAVYRADLGDGSSGVPEYGFSYGPPDDDAEFTSLNDAYNHVMEYAKSNNLSIIPVGEDGKTKGNDSLGMARISNEDSSISQGFSSGRENAKTRVKAAYGTQETRRGNVRGEFIETGTSDNRRERRLSSGADTTSVDYRLDMLRGDTQRRVSIPTGRPVINKDSIIPNDRAMEIINDPINNYNAETGWPISLNRFLDSIRFDIDTSDMIDEDGNLDSEQFKKALSKRISSLFKASTNVDRTGFTEEELNQIIDKVLKGKDKNGKYIDEVFIDSAAAVSIVDPLGSRGEEHLDSWFGFDARPVWITRDDAFDPTDELRTGKQQWSPLTREQFNSELDTGIPPEPVYQHPYAWFNEDSSTEDDSRTWGFGDPRTTKPVDVQSDKGKAEAARVSRANAGGEKGVVSPETSRKLMLSIAPGGDAEVTMTQFARMLGIETEGRTIALKGEMAREMAEKLGIADVETLKTALRHQPKTADGVPIVPLHLILNARRAGIIGSFEEAAKLANSPSFTKAAEELDRRVFVGTAISRIKQALESVGKYKSGEYENLWRGKRLIGEASSPDFVSVRTEKPFKGQSKFTGAEFLSEDDMRAIIDRVNAEYDTDLSFDSLFEKDEQGRIKDNFGTPELSSGASREGTGRRFVAAEKPDRMAGASADTAEVRGFSSGATKPIYRNQSGGIDHTSMSRDIDAAFRGPKNGRAGITEENAATVGRDQMNSLEAAVNLRQEIAEMFPDVVNNRTGTTLDVEPRLIDQGVPAAEAEKIADKLVELDKYIEGIVDQFDEEAEKLQGSLRQVNSMLADLENLRKTKAKMVSEYGEDDSVNIVSRLDDQIAKLSDAAEKLYDETVNSQLSDMAKLRDEATDLVDKNPGFTRPRSDTRALSSGADSLSSRLIATELAMGRSVDGQMPKYKPISKWDWDYPAGTRLSSGKTDAWYTNLTAKMIEMIEKSQQEGGKWEAPWHRTSGLPRNGVSKHQFAGGNSWWLMIAAEEKGYTSPVWATYDQWASVGGQVRKGEKSTYVLRPNFKPIKNEETGKVEQKLVGWSTYPVFNIDQIDGVNKEEYTETPVDKLDDAQRVELAEKAFAALGATIKTGDGSSAHYSPSKDEVVMPPFGYFKTPEGYYATLGHELVHWTGHSSRMDRPNMNGFGTEAYAREELVAEIGSAFLLAHFGIAAEPRPDHAHYLASWLKALREEPDALQKASQEAQKAVKFLIEQMRDVLKDAGLAEDGLDKASPDVEEKSIWGGIGWQLTKSSIDPLALPQHLVELANFAVENYDQKTAEKTVKRISKTLNFLESLSRNKGNR